MKVFETDLVVGDEYYLAGTKGTIGVFVGCFLGGCCFHKTSKDNGWNDALDEDGTVTIPLNDFYYEEV